MDGKGRKCRAPGWSRVEGGLPVFMVIQGDMRSWQMAEERWPWGPLGTGQGLAQPLLN